MSFKNRTNEFQRICERKRQKLQQSAQEKRALISSPKASSSSRKLGGRSEFSLMASEIYRSIGNTQDKLEKLTKLAKRTALFDDKPVQINELTSIIKKDIANLNRQIVQLQDYTKLQKQSSKQAKEHTSNIVVSLQSKLADASMNFKNVLEVRTESMKASKERQGQFLYSLAEQSRNRHDDSSMSQPRNRKALPAASSSSLIAADEEEESTLSLGIPMITQQQQQQQMMMAEQDNYIESRSTAIESIESTIAELGGIFQQLATMIAEQRETVQRIDQNTDDIEMNVMGAQRELLKYYASISSNRWLILKVFTTVFLFFLLFTLIM